MHYCQYHPDKAASYYCHRCHTYSCDVCSKETSHATCRCFVCNDDLESLGTGLSAEPFWRRLDQTFRYAFHAEVLIFIAVTSILSTILMFAPGIWSMVFLLMVVSAFIKYCFVCLESTAFGKMQPPSITSAYEDGVSSLIKLAFVFILVFGMSTLAVTFLGINIGALVTVALICALPAALIILALEGSPFNAVNPIQLWGVITSIGFAYGVLLAFILVMSSSVAILSNLFIDGFSILGLIAQSFISSFYTVVMFHMMGYMIYQYQNDLGFTARDDELDRQIRTDEQKFHAHINMLLREGKFNEVSALYKEESKRQTGKIKFTKQHFDYLIALKDQKDLPQVANTYIRMLVQKQQWGDARVVYKQVAHICQGFKPSSAHLRYELAKSFHEANDAVIAVNLINGIHRDEPEFEKLPEAYAFCADVLDELGTKPKDAENYRRYSQALEQKRTQVTREKEQKLNSMLVPKEAGVATVSTQASLNESGNNQTQKNTSPMSANVSQGAKEQQVKTPESKADSLSGLSLVPMDDH